jgi:hypothetical protein
MNHPILPFSKAELEVALRSICQQRFPSRNGLLASTPLMTSAGASEPFAIEDCHLAVSKANRRLVNPEDVSKRQVRKLHALRSSSALGSDTLSLLRMYTSLRLRLRLR